jgi:hypothetical protein
MQDHPRWISPDDAITDPAQIAAITRGLRRPLKLTRRQRWLIGAAALSSTLKRPPGVHRLDNLCSCCFWSNAFKQARAEARDPRTDTVTRLFHPRLDSWSDHFRWSRDGTRILGRTAVGRATVAALRLNRSILVKARRLWVRHGLHPPQA